MKKISAIVLAAAMAVSMVACGGSSAPAASEAPAAPAASEAAPAASEAAPAEGGALTSESTPVVNLNGEFTKDKIQEGVLLTNVGQSADTATIASLLTRANAAFDEEDLATADNLEGHGTLIVVAGASTKGLGSAGISQEEELARAKDLLAAADSKGMTIILAHIGGSGRRGSTSDLFIDVVKPYADYMLVVEDGNGDGYFTDYCAANNIPLTLVKSAKNASETISALFA